MRRRAIAGAVSVAVLAGAALLVAHAVTARPRPAASTAAVPTGTAEVTRGTVTQWLRINGTYGFDGDYSVVHQGPPGILTEAAEPGSTVERGEVLYTVDNQDVRLLYGSLPAYREFAPGMTDGRDVLQLERNLAALGLSPGLVDQRFTAATGTAIRRWQASWGAPAARRTGRLPRGHVVFLPVALRIGRVTPTVGTAVGANEPVLAATSTSRVVRSQVSADRQASVEVGDEVLVVLPTAGQVSGKVVRTSPVATVADPQREDGPPGPATIAVVIGVTVPAGTPDLDQASVLVSIASGKRENVLLVPVAALLARPGGGYRVRLASGDYVEVRPGLFDEATGKVEVTGAVNPGDLVEVPAT
jgi:hypothetical protein